MSLTLFLIGRLKVFQPFPHAIGNFGIPQVAVFF